MMRAAGPGVAAAVGVKVLLFALVALTIVERDTIGGRTTTARILLYPVVALTIPFLWLVLRRSARRNVGYPGWVDALATLPFALDLAAVLAELRDRFTWWDEVAHFTYWGLLAGAIAAFLALRPFHPLVLAGLTTGAGAATAIGWEVLEYYTLHATESERAAEYAGTVRDLALALAASVLAGLAAAAWHATRVATRRPQS